MKRMTLVLLILILVSALLTILGPNAQAASNWQFMGPAGSGVPVKRMIIDQNSPNKIFAFIPKENTGPGYLNGNNFDVYISLNSGESWDKLENLEPTRNQVPIYRIGDLKTKPGSSSVFYLAGQTVVDYDLGITISGIFRNASSLQGIWDQKYDLNELYFIGISLTTPEVIYSGISPAPYGNQYLIQTTNEGASWENKISSPFGNFAGAITALAVSSSDTKKIIFAVETYNYATNESGLFISTNEGASYTQTQGIDRGFFGSDGGGGGILNNIFIREGAYSAGEINAFAFGTIQLENYYRSTNEGETWEERSYPVSDYCISASLFKKDFKTIYIVIGPSIGGANFSIWKTTNCGDSWMQLSKSGLPVTSANNIYVDPGNSDVVYLCTQAGIYRSADGGNSWTGKNTGIGSGKVSEISVKKNMPSKIFILNNNAPYKLYRSIDYGGAWQNLTTLPNARLITQNRFATNEIYAARPFILSKSNDDGQSWTSIFSTGEYISLLAASEVTKELVYVQTLHFTNYAPYDDGWLYKIADDGASFTRLSASGSEEIASAIALSPTSSLEIYKGRNIDDSWAIKKSTDGGASWSTLTTPSGMKYVNDIAIDPTDSDIVYVACGSAEGAGGLWKSINGGGSWPTNFTPASGFVKQVAVCPSNHAVLYASVLTDNLTGYKVYKSVDSGSNWSPISGGSSGLDDSRPVYALEVDPQSHVLVYAGTDNGVYKGFVDVPAPSLESIVPVSGSQFFPTAVTISGNYFFNLSRVYLSKGPDTWDLAISSYTPISIEAIVPAGAVPGTYEVKVVGGFGVSMLGPTFEVLAADINGPVISKVKFDGRYYYANCPISKSPLITAIATDEDNVSPESFALLLYNRSDSSIRSIPCPQAHPATFPTTEMVYSYKVGSAGEPALSDGTYALYIAAKDMASPFEHDGAWLGQVRVYGGTVKTIGDLLAYPTPFKPLSGQRLSIAYNLTQNAKVTMYVYDISGKVILTKKFGSGSQGGHAGYNEITWDGMTDFGKMAPNGIVVIKLTVGNKAIGTLKIPVID